MLVLLHFNQLGYTPVQLAFLLLLYEFFGIVTNLVGGWVASRTAFDSRSFSVWCCRSWRSACWRCSTRTGPPSAFVDCPLVDCLRTPIDAKTSFSEIARLEVFGRFARRVCLTANRRLQEE